MNSNYLWLLIAENPTLFCELFEVVLRRTPLHFANFLRNISQ